MTAFAGASQLGGRYRGEQHATDRFAVTWTGGIDPHETSAVPISPPQGCRSEWHTGTEGKTAVAAPVPEQRRVRAEAKTEGSEVLPPDKHQRKDSDAEPVAHLSIPRLFAWPARW